MGFEPMVSALALQCSLFDILVPKHQNVRRFPSATCYSHKFRYFFFRLYTFPEEILINDDSTRSPPPPPDAHFCQRTHPSPFCFNIGCNIPDSKLIDLTSCIGFSVHFCKVSNIHPLRKTQSNQQSQQTPLHLGPEVCCLMRSEQLLRHRMHSDLC